MHSADNLHNILKRINGSSYKAYKELKGAYDFPDFILFIDHVQGDPFAAPSRIRVRVKREKTGIPEEIIRQQHRRIAVGDFLTRQCIKAIGRTIKGRRGSGKSGQVGMDRPGQQILERTSALINNDWVEARLTTGLPAAGRRVLGEEAIKIFFQEIPTVVRESLLSKAINQEELNRHWQTYEEAELIREKLGELGLVAFVANGSILPRRSGVDDRPLSKAEAVPFLSPPELEVAIDLPYSGKRKGMGIPQGITLIVGGGYHGKSTLLRALEKGVYNHLPGDGREYAVTLETAVKIRSEDGRAVTTVDISPFINNLPYIPGHPEPDTSVFSSVNASGSTSQAANISEALEIGAELLLVDEDTSATNFMIRDERMQALVAKEKEPITPFIDQIVPLKKRGVSSILALGGSGDYLDLADTVIMMDAYRCRMVTGEAQRICREHPSRRRPEATCGELWIKSRVPLPEGLNPSVGARAQTNRRGSPGREKVKIKARGTQEIGFGPDKIDLSAVEQLVHDSQVRFIGELLYFFSEKAIDGKRSLREILELCEQILDRDGLDKVTRDLRGDFARPRRFEVAAALNRLRGLEIKGVEGKGGGTRVTRA